MLKGTNFSYIYLQDSCQSLWQFSEATSRLTTFYIFQIIHMYGFWAIFWKDTTLTVPLDISYRHILCRSFCLKIKLCLLQFGYFLILNKTKLSKNIPIRIVWGRLDWNCYFIIIFCWIKEHNTRVPGAILLELGLEIMPITILIKFGDVWMEEVQLRKRTVIVDAARIQEARHLVYQ